MVLIGGVACEVNSTWSLKQSAKSWSLCESVLKICMYMSLFLKTDSKWCPFILGCGKYMYTCMCSEAWHKKSWLHIDKFWNWVQVLRMRSCNICKLTASVVQSQVGRYSHIEICRSYLEVWAHWFATFMYCRMFELKLINNQSTDSFTMYIRCTL